MGLRLKLEETGERLFIDNKNPAFEGTRFAAQPFKIYYVRMTRTEEFAIEKRHTRFIRRTQRDVKDDLAIDREKFCRQVLDWDGLEDAKGAQIPCSQENKVTILEHERTFGNLIVLAIFNEETGLLDDEVFPASQMEGEKDGGDSNPLGETSLPSGNGE